MMFPKHRAHGIASQALAQQHRPFQLLIRAWLYVYLNYFQPIYQSEQCSNTTQLIGLSPEKKHILAFLFPLQVQVQSSEIMNHSTSELNRGLERAGPTLESGSVVPHDDPSLIHIFPEGSLNPQKDNAPFIWWRRYSWTHPWALLRAGAKGFHISFPSTQRAQRTSLQQQWL